MDYGRQYCYRRSIENTISIIEHGGKGQRGAKKISNVFYVAQILN